MNVSQFQFTHHSLASLTVWGPGALRAPPLHDLDVFRVARQMADRAKVIADRVPRGYRKWADQLLRAAGSTVGLIGEGANRFTAGQKRQKFTEARGEAGEVAAWVELLHSCGMVGEVEAVEVLKLADRVCAMLTGLIRRHA